MKYFIWYRTNHTEGYTLRIVPSEKEVMELIDLYAENPDFRYTVVQGKVVDF